MIALPVFIDDRFGWPEPTICMPDHQAEVVFDQFAKDGFTGNLVRKRFNFDSGESLATIDGLPEDRLPELRAWVRLW